MTFSALHGTIQGMQEPPAQESPLTLLSLVIRRRARRSHTRLSATLPVISAALSLQVSTAIAETASDVDSVLLATPLSWRATPAVPVLRKAVEKSFSAASNAVIKAASARADFVERVLR